MLMNFKTLPALSVVTRPLAKAPSLVELANPSDPLLWVREDVGFVGQSIAIKLDFIGKDRFAEASAALQELRAKAAIVDPLKLQGTGLLAFATFAFDDNSETKSSLIVPRVIIGRNGQDAWVTTVAVEGEADPQANLFAEELGTGPSASFIEPSGEATAYREGVLEASARIGRGSVEKIVLARRLQAEIANDCDLRVPLARLAERYTDCWTFAVDGMLGSSPETLIRSIGGEVSARVLAGTRKRALDEGRDLAMRDELEHSDKEHHEHKLAVESLVETLSPYVTELHADPDPHLLKLPNVWHLATNVRASLARGADAIELAGAVHPTAAVAGTPTPLAVAAIAELEPFDRGRYAGAVGWIDGNGDGDFAIALRSAQISETPSGRLVTAFAGGGLVEGSDPWHELTETVAKFRPIIEAFS